MEATAPVHVRAPATSANLGPAFDAAGVALDWWDELEVRPAPADGMQLSGEQAELLPTGRDNLVRVAMRRLAEAARVPLPPLHLTVVKGFPLGRGFGSSAAAVVLGLVAARELVAPDFPEAELLALACELEGHPDNATPCLHGGATLAWVEDGRPRWRAVPLHPDLVALALVAPEPMATSEARRLLPERVPFAVAAHTGARSAMLPLALAGDTELLLPATEDLLHQPQRLAQHPRRGRAARAAAGGRPRRLRVRGRPVAAGPLPPPGRPGRPGRRHRGPGHHRRRGLAASASSSWPAPAPSAASHRGYTAAQVAWLTAEG